jgi:hypothetical protein
MRHIPGQAFPVAPTQLPPPRRPGPLQPPVADSNAAHDWANTTSTTCSSGSASQLNHPAGPLAPTSPTRAARATAPSAYSGGKLARDCADTPNAANPANVIPRLMHDSGLTVHGRAEATDGTADSSVTAARNARAPAASRTVNPM